MSHEYRNAAAFKRAQWAYDNMAPPEDGPCECPECDGTGSDPAACEDHEDDTCQCCGGTGYVDANGEPFDPAQAERDRDEYADLRRERQQQEQQQ